MNTSIQNYKEEEFIQYGLENPDAVKLLLKILRRKSVRDSSFDLNLAEGKASEDLVETLLGGETKIEVKMDTRAADTGNLLVEFAKNGKPTGISVTQADWYAFVLEGSLESEVVMLIKTSRLKKMIDEFGKVNPLSGTGDKSDFVLIPINTIFSQQARNISRIFKDRADERVLIYDPNLATAS